MSIKKEACEPRCSSEQQFIVLEVYTSFLEESAEACLLS